MLWVALLVAVGSTSWGAHDWMSKVEQQPIQTTAQTNLINANAAAQSTLMNAKMDTLASSVTSMATALSTLQTTVAGLPVQQRRLDDLERAAAAGVAKDSAQDDALAQLKYNQGIDHADLERTKSDLRDYIAAQHGGLKGTTRP